MERLDASGHQAKLCQKTPLGKLCKGQHASDGALRIPPRKQYFPTQLPVKLGRFASNAIAATTLATERRGLFTNVSAIPYALRGATVTYQAKPFKEANNPIGTVAELFAGVGGFRIGLARAGWRTVYSNQWEPSTKAQHASDVYVANFGSEGHSNEDIATVEKIPVNFDLLVGGFPCQDYSVAKSLKSATGLQGKKGVLWWEILRLAVIHKPKYLFLENVDRLLKSPSNQRGRDFAVMLSSLNQAGYVVEWRVVNAADYGFPQRRIRVFIVATRKSRVTKKIDPADNLFHSGVLAQALPVKPSHSGLLEVPIDLDPEVVSQSFNLDKQSSPFSNSGFFHDGVAHAAAVEADYSGPSFVLRDVLIDDSEVAPEYWIDDQSLSSWVFLKGAKSIERVSKSTGFAYRYSEGKMSFPDSLDKPSRTVLTAEGGSTPSRFKHVIQTPGGMRRLTPVELERLSGFPDGWTAPSMVKDSITDGRRAFFIGNALVVGLIERVGQSLAKSLVAG